MNHLIRKPTTRDLFDFDRFVRGFFTGSDDVAVPAVDIKEQEGKYLMEVELPGLTEKDVEVKVENNVLTVSSNKEEHTEEEKKGYIRKERTSYSFYRSFALPEGTDSNKIAAHFKNGVLNIEIPKTPESKPKKIVVKAE